MAYNLKNVKFKALVSLATAVNLHNSTNIAGKSWHWELSKVSLRTRIILASWMTTLI